MKAILVIEGMTELPNVDRATEYDAFMHIKICKVEPYIPLYGRHRVLTIKGSKVDFQMFFEDLEKNITYDPQAKYNYICVDKRTGKVIGMMASFDI